MKSATAWGCAKVQVKHCGKVLVFVLENFRFMLPKHWVPNQPANYTIRGSQFYCSAPHNSVSQGCVVTTWKHSKVITHWPFLHTEIN